MAKADRNGEAGRRAEKDYVPVGGLSKEQGREVTASEDEVKKGEDVKESQRVGAMPVEFAHVVDGKDA